MTGNVVSMGEKKFTQNFSWKSLREETIWVI